MCSGVDTGNLSGWPGKASHGGPRAGTEGSEKDCVGAEPGGRGSSCAMLRAFGGAQGPSVLGRDEQGDSGKR